jgi:HSP90 family molecular chaperone
MIFLDIPDSVDYDSIKQKLISKIKLYFGRIFTSDAQEHIIILHK